MMIDGKFTAKERSYLASLPAVKSVSASHIRYTDQFRVECMCRYRAGESPAAIFREAGLDPKLIGYKRVERCIARWKRRQDKEAKSGKRTSPYALDADDLRILEHGNLTQSEWGSPNAGDSEEGLSQLARAQLAINERDLLIARQALRIDELERQVDMLEALLHGRRRKEQAANTLPEEQTDTAADKSPDTDGQQQ